MGRAAARATCSGLVVLLAATAGAAELPESLTGWSIRTPDSIDWVHSGYSTRDWYVWTEKGRLVVSDEWLKPADTLPFKIDPDREDGDPQFPIYSMGARQVLAVEDGYLVGFNAGEFGGALWWFSRDGTRRRRLTVAGGFAENVRAFTKLGRDILVFEGFMGSDAGGVVRLHRVSRGRWSLSVFANLPACPGAVIQDNEASGWLVATTAGIFILDAKAVLRPLWQPRDGDLAYPNSFARDSSGTVYMGMREFVVRVRRSGAREPDVDVLVPPGGPERANRRR